MSTPKRGEVWLVDLGYTAKVRLTIFQDSRKKYYECIYF
ncbi:hypothetical protein NIES73_44750 [Sphaerospermopsis kisseleviana NIES-73]|jgi:hypothetical protein|nr:hypothetical protein NIES73_44750 [Sphaerospermopsis kisseleviana NIES-73]